MERDQWEPVLTNFNLWKPPLLSSPVAPGFASPGVIRPYTITLTGQGIWGCRATSASSRR
jgi:hypothetical protein